MQFSFHMSDSTANRMRARTGNSTDESMDDEQNSQISRQTNEWMNEIGNSMGIVGTIAHSSACKTDPYIKVG